MGTKLLSRRSGQSAVEFTFLLLFVLFIATLVVVLLQQNLDRELERLDRQIVQEFRNVWYEEIQQASSVNQEYSREFEVNSNPRGFPVISRFGDDPNNVTDELVISYKGYEFLFFLPTEVDYTNIGQNVSLSDGVRISRRCQNECRIFLYDDEQVSPGVDGAVLDTVDTNLGSTNSMHGEWPLLFASGNAKFSMVNISDPTNMSLTQNYSKSGAQFNKVSEYEDIVAAPRSTAGGAVQLVNVSDPGSPTEISDFSVPGNPQKVVFDYPYSYIIQESPGGLSVYSLFNVSNPTEVSTASTRGGIDAAYDNKGYVYAATGAPEIEVYNVTDRLDASHANTKSLSLTSTRDVTYRDNHLYVVMDDDVAVYDVSDASSINRVSTLSIDDGDEGVLWRDYWFISDGSDGYDVIDVSDPRDIDRVTSQGFSSDVTGIHAGHDALYLYFDNTSVSSIR
jgi:hypothetical protein